MKMTINGIMKKLDAERDEFLRSVEFTIPSYAFGRGGGEISFTLEEAFFKAADLSSTGRSYADAQIFLNVRRSIEFFADLTSEEFSEILEHYQFRHLARVSQRRA